jgi:putative beta-lysine N-acetyltransferase
MANIYRQVFDTYPFPIYDANYIRKTMRENFIYFSIVNNDKIIALSSSEMDINLQNVEMTDFATLPEYQGKGFSLYLLHKMEDEMRKRNMKVSYTISRAMSYGINIIFAKMGYEYGGTLLNNTNISVIKNVSNNFESMNVWYKFIS